MSRALLIVLSSAVAAHAFHAPAQLGARPSRSPLPISARPCLATPRATPARTGGVSMFGGFSNGGFLNLGAPEMVVIGAVAWVVLGPKELFRLAKQAGEFVGQWQQLGQQAKDTFTSALEQEIAEDEAKNAPPAPPPPAWVEPPADPFEPETSMAATATDAAEGLGVGAEPLSAEDEAALRELSLIHI